MKRIILSLAVITAIVSCKDKGDNNLTTDETVAVSQEGKNASYAFGVSLGQQTENLNNNPALKDSLNYAKVEEGVKDYLKNPKDQSSYLQGLKVGEQIENALNNEILKGQLDKDDIVAGMSDYLNKKQLRIAQDSVNAVMDNFYKNLINKAAEKNTKLGAEYMNKVKQEEGVKTTPSGLAYKVVKEGTGKSPVQGDVVTVKYTGKNIKGTVFDSTDKNNNGEAVEIPLQEGGLIKGWLEGIQLMKEGGVSQFYIPADLAYGNQAMGQDIEAGSTLVFDIELINVKPGAAK